MTEQRPRRRRDAAATREAILRSALVAFTGHGYDGVGVRDIAGAAGVTAMLVNRYFGSKERLFAEVVEVAFADRTLIADDVESLSRFAASALVAAEPRSVDGFLLMLRSVANPRAAEILRAGIDAHFQRPLQALLPGAHARERAALFLSVLAGVRLMQHVLDSPALATADPVALHHRLRELFALLAGPASHAARPATG
jgi:AcrR family transcriptional regulator